MKLIKGFKTIGLYKVENGEEYYSYTDKHNHSDTVVYRAEDECFGTFDHGRKDVDLTAEAKAELFRVRGEFIKMLNGILVGDGAFRIAKDEKHLIAYRKETKADCADEIYFCDKTERNDLYRFIVFVGKGKVLQKVGTFDDLLEYPHGKHLSFCTVLSYSGKRKALLKQIENGTLALYRSAEKFDRYLYLSMKYLAGAATQVEADEASLTDGKVRFVPEDRVYGDGVTVGGLVYIRERWNRISRYSCTVTIDGREWNAYWYPGTKRLHVEQYTTYPQGTAITVSDEVYNSLCLQAGIKPNNPCDPAPEPLLNALL